MRIVTSTPCRPRVSRPRFFSALSTQHSALLLLLFSGCTVVGLVAGKTSSVKVKPYYTGLKGQSVGVMVWAPRATRIDFPELQLAIAQSLEKKPKNARTAKAEQLLGTQFPPDRGPDAMYAIQQNYPGLMAEPIADVAPKLGVSRLIYIEVEEYTLHPETVPDLWRGMLTARVQVVEVDGGKGRPAYDDRVSVKFPPAGPEEGRPDLGQAVTEVGTIDGFTTAVLQKFVTYEE